MTISFDDVTHCFAVPGENHMIDGVHPVTGKTIIRGLTLEEIRQEKGSEKAELMTVEDFCKAKAARQDTPLEWHEITEERYSEWLECLPPAMYQPDGFLVGEPSDHHAITGRPRYQACREQGGKFYASNRPMERFEFKVAMGVLLKK